MRSWFFPLFFLTVLFMDELFATFLTAFSIPLASGMLQIEYIAISIVAYIIFFTKLIGNNTRSQIWIIILIVSLMYSSRFLYDNIDATFYGSYQSSLLFFLSGCVSSIIVGMYLAKAQTKELLDNICNALPYFNIIIGYIVGTMGLLNARISVFSSEDNILDYQSVSYMMAEIFAYSVYCVFYKKWGKNPYNSILKTACASLIIFAPIACLAAGGRGGAVLLIVYILFFGVLFVKSKIISIPKLILTLFVSSVVLYCFSTYLNLASFDGFLRISSSMTTDEGRTELYKGALTMFKESPIFGHGIGSVWLKNGIYSHNIFLDILAETGVVGFIIIVIILAKLFIRTYRYCIFNPWYTLLFIALLKGAVLDMFSGYWLNTLQLWLVFGFIFYKNNLVVKKY